MKYKNLKHLIDAFECHQISKDDCHFILDNDSTPMIEYLEDLDTSIELYNGGTPNQLLREALTLLGIPWEEV